MKNLGLDSVLFYGLLLVFAMVYLFTFPQGWLISDEYTYVNQAMAIANGQTRLSFMDMVTNQEVNYNYTPYTLGNSFWIAFWMKLFGVKMIFLGSLFALLAGSIFLYKTIDFNHHQVSILGLLFIYPSFEFFGVSTMSAIPSFMIVSVFIWYLFSKKETKWKWFGLALLASFSFWFRETNIVILGAICLVHFLQDRRWFWYYFAGMILGMVPRLVSSYFFYGDPFYYVIAESFSLSNIANNFFIYALLILICMPLGLFFLSAYKGRYRVPIVTSCLIFLGLYLTYSFNASVYSGFEKGVILMGRFLIPLLPFYVLAVAWYFRNVKISRSITILAFLFVGILMLGMKYKVHQEAKIHNEVSERLYDTYEGDHIFFDLSKKTNVIRYLNPMHGSFTSQADVTQLLNAEYVERVLELHKNVYIIQTLNKANEAKSEITKMITEVVDEASMLYSFTEVENIKIKPGLNLQVLKIGKKNE